ncbi:regulator of sigma E protease [Trypanosoma cruzi]|nr:regulator of sigma E protease [Trypanosoma cruzi]
MSVRPSCSICSLLAVPRNHWKQPAAGERYRAHLRVVTANSFSLIVGSSGPSARRSVRAWDTTGVTLFSHSQAHLHAEAPQCRMRCSTQMPLLGPSHPSCSWEACPDTTKRACPQAPQTNILPSN